MLKHEINRLKKCKTYLFFAGNHKETIRIFRFHLVVYDFTANSLDAKVGRLRERGHWSKAVGDKGSAAPSTTLEPQSNYSTIDFIFKQSPQKTCCNVKLDSEF